MEIHHNSFEKLKEVLQSDLLLTHFDPEMNIIIAADASDYGVGAVISHQFAGGQEKANAHAGRALTKAEKSYGQIEKEALALVFAVRKFHRFVYGRRFTLLTDHKPLLSIFGSKKGISAHAANRLQRWNLFCWRTISKSNIDELRILGKRKPCQGSLIPKRQQKLKI